MPSDDRLNLSRTSRTAFGMIDRFPEVFRRIRSRNRTGGSTPRLNEQLEVAIVEDDLRLRFALHPSVTASALHLCVKDRKDVPLLTLPSTVQMREQQPFRWANVPQRYLRRCMTPMHNRCLGPRVRLTIATR